MYYADLWFPQIAESENVRIGRYLSIPDIVSTNKLSKNRQVQAELWPDVRFERAMDADAYDNPTATLGASRNSQTMIDRRHFSCLNERLAAVEVVLGVCASVANCDPEKATRLPNWY